MEGVNRVVFACLLVLACGGGAAKQEGPNILLIMLDQWRFSAYGAMGNSNVTTPAMDSIAQQGMLFTHYTTPQPVCTASRVAMNASVWPHTYGVRLNPGTTTLFSELKKAGYRNGFVGKWHMTPKTLRLPTNPDQYVPPEVRSDIDWFAGYEHWHRYYGKGVYFVNNDTTAKKSGPFEPASQVALVRSFMTREVKRGNKFFLTVSFGPPHDRYNAMNWATNPDSIVLRENVPQALHSIARESLSHYYGLINRLDALIQSILDTLEQAGVGDDTIVILTSDHGAMLFSQGEEKKRKPWEESIRVPFAIRWTHGGIRAGSESGALLANIDVMPTILGLVGLPIPSGLAGMDHSPLMLGQSFTPRSSIYIEFPARHREAPFGQPWRGVRTADGWTYVTSLGQTDWLLYDNKADPFQMANLIKDPDSAEKKAELDALTRSWAARTQDPYPFP